MHTEWVADDFVSIGSMPDGSVFRSEKRNISKPTKPGEKSKLPAATFTLSTFKVVTTSPEVNMITYQADGPLHLYIRTTWTILMDEWKVFYTGLESINNGKHKFILGRGMIADSNFTKIEKYINNSFSK